MTKQPFSKNHFATIHSVLIVAAAIILGGCGHKGPEVVRVTGTVTHQGKPVPNLTLNFMPEKGRPSWGLTDENGHYSLNYNRERNGAVTGKHTVWVRFTPQTPIEEMQGGKPLPPGLQKYGSVETTPLVFEVTTDDQVIDIKLDPT